MVGGDPLALSISVFRALRLVTVGFFPLSCVRARADQ